MGDRHKSIILLFNQSMQANSACLAIAPLACSHAPWILTKFMATAMEDVTQTLDS